jgi:chemotaxis protein MotB
MAAFARRSRRPQDDGEYWPAFVDALGNLLMVTIFLVTLFSVAQYVLGSELTSKDKEMSSLQSKLSQLADSLALEESKNKDLSENVLRLESSLSEASARAEDASKKLLLAQAELQSANEASDTAKAQAAVLSQQVAALNDQLAKLNAALEASEKRDKDSKAQIRNLSERLNAALAQEVQKLANARSVFFERMQAVIGDRTDIRVVGDRFLFESDVLFDTGSAELSDAGKQSLGQIAQVILSVMPTIPSDVDWIVRVDGHTDIRPINSAVYPSNWYLSSARAITVVNFFEDQGVPSRRLVAAGFGEWNPIDPAHTDEAYAKNRRIELKLDSR